MDGLPRRGADGPHDGRGGEDAAEHALTLAQWRVNILKSKLQQAQLSKRLMAVSSPQVVEGEEVQREREGDEAREVGDRGEDEGQQEEGKKDAAEETPAVSEAVEKTDAQAQVLLCVYTQTHEYVPLLSGICALSACRLPFPAGKVNPGFSSWALDLRLACRSCPGSRLIS